MRREVNWYERPIAMITSNFNDWTGTVEEWRTAFFKLLSYKNSFSGFLELTINSNFNHTPFLYMVIDTEALKLSAVEELLKEYGYAPKIHTSTARFVDYLDLDEDFEGNWYFD